MCGLSFDSVSGEKSKLSNRAEVIYHFVGLYTGGSGIGLVGGEW